MVVFGATGDTTKFAPLQSRSFFPSTGGGRGLSLPAWLCAPEAVPGTDALMLLQRMGKAPLSKYVAVRVDAPNSWIATRSERPHCSVFSFCLCYRKTKLFPEDGVPNHPTTDLYSFFFFLILFLSITGYRRTRNVLCSTLTWPILPNAVVAISDTMNFCCFSGCE